LGVELVTGLWVANQIALWVFCIFMTLLVIGLYRQIGELSISPSRRAAMAEGLQIGDEAPAFELTDYQGRSFSFPNGNGRSVVVFGEADCPPCNKLAGQLNSVADDIDSVIFVAGEDGDDNRRFAAEHRLTFPVLSDPASATMRAYKVRSTPFIYVIDERGTVRAKGITNSAEGVRELVSEGLGNIAPSRRRS
jgi:methylamine dehydrogenase accessory protein MauD